MTSLIEILPDLFQTDQEENIKLSLCLYLIKNRRKKNAGFPTEKAPLGFLDSYKEHNYLMSDIYVYSHEKLHKLIKCHLVSYTFNHKAYTCCLLSFKFEYRAKHRQEYKTSIQLGCQLLPWLMQWTQNCRHCRPDPPSRVFLKQRWHSRPFQSVCWICSSSY